MSPDAAGLNFGQPLWLWGLLVVPLVLAWLWWTAPRAGEDRLRRFADAELLPHLLRHTTVTGNRGWQQPALWGLLWSLGIVAMAGPRWDFSAERAYRPDIDLVVMLDISRSMETRDVSPSRLVRARQEVRDLVEQARGMRIGLIVFASVAQVVVPLTEDREAIRRVLPQLSSDLVRLQGSRPSEALARARRLLLARPEAARVAVLISDGDIIEPGLEQQAAQFAADGARLYVIGVGSAGGGPVPGDGGVALRDARGQPVFSRRDETWLQAVAAAGDGLYRAASYQDDDVQDILRAITEGTKQGPVEAREVRLWNERFYWLLIPAALLLLPWYRRVRAASGATPAPAKVLR